MIQLRSWRAVSAVSDFILDVKDDTMKGIQKGFTLYGRPVVPDNLVENPDPLRRNGTWFSDIQADHSGSGFSECVFEQNCGKLCFYAYRHMYDSNKGSSWIYCEVGFLWTHGFRLHSRVFHDKEIQRISVGLSDRSEVTQHKINFVKNCPQWDLSSQPPDQQSNALLTVLGRNLLKISKVSFLLFHAPLHLLGLYFFLESIERDFIKALMIHTDNQIVT